MAKAAVDTLGRADGGLAATRYGHVKGVIPGADCYEAGHPVPDENGFAATERALEPVGGLTERDAMLFLLSGGGAPSSPAARRWSAPPGTGPAGAIRGWRWS